MVPSRVEYWKLDGAGMAAQGHCVGADTPQWKGNLPQRFSAKPADFTIAIVRLGDHADVWRLTVIERWGWVGQ